MKIYTRKGDSGHTSLISGKIVDKHNTTVDAYGTIDELNSFIGLLKDYVEEIPDFPIKGILFKDISPLIANYQAMSYVKASFLDIIKSYHVDYIGGIDARGFLFSTLLADALGVGSFMIRKEGKLPGKVITKEYSLEYGTSKMSIRQNINLKNKNIILVDAVSYTNLRAH